MKDKRLELASGLVGRERWAMDGVSGMMETVEVWKGLEEGAGENSFKAEEQWRQRGFIPPHQREEDETKPKGRYLTVAFEV